MNLRIGPRYHLKPASFVLAALLVLPFAAAAAPVQYLSGASGYLVSATDGQFYFDSAYHPNGKQGSANLSRDGISLYASSDLVAGQLKMRSTGSLGITYGSVNAGAAAFLLDTITAQGSLGGSNLGLTLALSGTTSSSSILDNANFLLVGFYPVGHLQAATDGLRDFYDPAYRIWGVAYALGSQANPNPNLDGYHYTVSGSYGDGVTSVPLNVPFNLIGNSFELHLLLGTQQGGDSVTMRTWNNDFAHTVGVSLSADPGITLNSFSGLPGTLSNSPVPEPRSAAMMTLGLAFFALARLQRRGRA